MINARCVAGHCARLASIRNCEVPLDVAIYRYCGSDNPSKQPLGSRHFSTKNRIPKELKGGRGFFAVVQAQNQHTHLTRDSFHLCDVLETVVALIRRACERVSRKRKSLSVETTGRVLFWKRAKNDYRVQERPASS